MEDWGDGAGTDNCASALVAATKRAFRRWDAHLKLAVWRETAARATGPGVRVIKKSGSPQERGCPFPGDGGVRTSVSLLEERVVCERNRDLSRTRPPQMFLVCDHAGLVIDKFALFHVAETVCTSLLLFAPGSLRPCDSLEAPGWAVCRPVWMSLP